MKLLIKRGHAVVGALRLTWTRLSNSKWAFRNCNADDKFEEMKVEGLQNKYG